EVVAIDGKALRRAANAGERLDYIVSAWAAENELVLGQVKVKDKSNEITAIPELPEVLDLDGCIVTIDAMGCQKTIAKGIVKQGADYVLALKGNHATVLDEVKDYFADAVPPCATQCADTVSEGVMDFFETNDKGHGRIETRLYWQSIDIDWFEDKPLWKGLKSFGMVESLRRTKESSSIERRYYLSTLPLDAQTFGRAVRDHWGVENGLHWTLDVLFREDDSRARTGNASQNLGTLRRIATNLFKRNTSRKIPMRQKRILAALETKFLEELLGI
ncbi:MAG: ISAs1 family transposase, partial [bacterium]|nr:ISAs1 family transposase [bacterium]